jgi:hypothetical protein
MHGRDYSTQSRPYPYLLSHLLRYGAAGIVLLRWSQRHSPRRQTARLTPGRCRWWTVFRQQPHRSGRHNLENRQHLPLPTKPMSEPSNARSGARRAVTAARRCVTACTPGTASSLQARREMMFLPIGNDGLLRSKPEVLPIRPERNGRPRLGLPFSSPLVAPGWWWSRQSPAPGRYVGLE